ncbi:uncharacterized protein LOC135811910 isoform X2 [Sycon ciliatum]|uniref:uncharacterized protein LOC135811910 isoform X2 n=1 Tax=Sycon ciliatum TaxID=27933 RepID=UPI0031F6D1E2
MASPGLCLGVLIGCLLLFSPLLLIGCNGQPVTLTAGGIGQSTTAFIVTFGDGQPTANVTGYLPVCVAASGSGSFIRLEKTDGSLVLAETGAFTVFGRAPVNITVHPILNTSYTGLYHCRTATHISSQTYQLNIVAQRSQSGPPPSQKLNFTDATHTMPCMSSGNFPLNASWNSTLSLDSQMIQTTMPATMVNSTFSFQQNDSQIMFTESDTSGVTFNVTCTTLYTTSFDCIGNGSTPARPQSVIDRCVGATRIISTTSSVTIQALCPDLNGSFDTLPGSTESFECAPGFLSNNSMAITQSTCQGNGMWQPRQPLCERCSMICNNASVTNCSNIIMSNIRGVSCPCSRTDEIWIRSPPGCVPTHCAARNLNFTVSNIPRMEVNKSMIIACAVNYTSTGNGSIVTCLRNGTLSNLPVCTKVNRTDPTPKDGSIGTGAIVGIAVGGAVLAIVLVVIIILVIKKQPSGPILDPDTGLIEINKKNRARGFIPPHDPNVPATVPMNRIPAHLTSGGDYDVVPPNATTALGAQGTNTTGQMAANGEAENEYDVALPPTAAKPGADPAGDTYDTFTFNTEPTGEGPDPSTYDHIGKVLPNAAVVTAPASASPAVPKPDVYSTVDSTNLAPQAPALATTPTQPPPDAAQGTAADDQLPPPNLESPATDSPAPPRDVYSMVDPTKKKRNK